MFRMWALLGAVALATVILALLSPLKSNAAATLPAGFQESVVFSGLTSPTNVEFSKDGRIFVAEKRGLIKVFDNLSDTTPTTFADLRTKVQNYSDRGLLGLAVDPEFPTNPYVYVSYTHDAPIGGTAPRWGDTCPNPPGGTTDGCVVSSHLSRLQADVTTNTMTGPEQVLIEDWCQQYPSHSVGDLAFGPDGSLYVSHGEGASFTFWDYGQGGGSTADSPTPKNPCGDPPTGVGGTQTPPTAEGGSLRSQDLRTGGDPVTLDGAILRVDPATGAALPGNPLIGDADPNARRIVAYGQRNPFRLTIRPGTNEVWVGNVGGGATEEIDRVSNPTGSVVQNSGWPCYEGTGRLSQFDSLNVNICENLYSEANAVTAPYYSYTRSQELVAGETTAGCETGATISGLAFYTTGAYPDEYDDALFFGDYSRSCIWAMQKGANGLPDRANLKTFVAGAATPVDLEIGPNGDLFYVDIGGGTIRRIQFSGGNQPPVARATANPTSGPTPLSVNFDGAGSSDPDGDSLTYAWDLDGDGSYDDSTSPQPTYTYSTAGTYAARLQVTDARGASDTLDEPLAITAGNSPPTATIDTPLPTATWKVGEGISFSGKASDGEDGALPASALSWKWIGHHCPTADTCHEHVWEDFPGVASGTFTAPDHGYPSYLELRLTATDSGGLTDTKSVRLDPQTVELNFQSDPAGLKLMVGGTESTTPFSRTAIVGSKNFISAPSPQALAGTTYNYASWSDGGAQSHDIVAPDAAADTYTATYTPVATQSVSVASSADTIILENTPTTNYGATTPVGADGDEPTGSGRDKSSLLKWSVSTIPAGSKISSASVTLNVTNSSTQTYQAFGLKQPWAESAATWALYAAGQPWQIAGANGSLDRDAQAAGTIRPSTTGKQTFTLSPALVQSWLDNPQGNNGIIITNTSNTDGFDFSSRESTTSSLRPQLDVTYTKPTGGTDTTAPAVTNVAPVAGATDVAITTNVEATFSEAMDASTIDDSTFTLVKQGASQPVAAQVSYDLATMKATLDPGGEILDLDPSATYIATIKGGASGAKDLAGNPLDQDKSWSFTTAAAPPADTTPPETTITSGPSATVNSTSATFEFSSSEAGSTFECRLDSTTFSSCTSPQQYSGLAEGSHTFEVRATDAAGNTDAIPASRTWTVDTATTRSLTSTADTKLLENTPTTAYGSATTLTGDGDEPNNRSTDVYALIRWDLSSIPAGSKVSSVSITLNVTNGSKNTYQVFGLKRPWVESAATWLHYAANNPWEVAGAKGSLDRGAQVGSVPAPKVGKQTFTLSASVVQGWIENPSSNQGIIVANTTNTDGFDFSSRESTTSSLRPQLNVTYTAP
jgi:glucose/arabinose dehydrogenase/PKD repeat protein